MRDKESGEEKGADKMTSGQMKDDIAISLSPTTNTSTSSMALMTLIKPVVILSSPQPTARAPEQAGRMRWTVI